MKNINLFILISIILSICSCSVNQAKINNNFLDSFSDKANELQGDLQAFQQIKDLRELSFIEFLSRMKALEPSARTVVEEACSYEQYFYLACENQLIICLSSQTKQITLCINSDTAEFKVVGQGGSPPELKSLFNDSINDCNATIEQGQMSKSCWVLQ